MDQILQQLWNAGIPLFLLVVGIVVVWRQWRLDMTEAASQRERTVDALKSLEGKVQAQVDEISKLTKSLSEVIPKRSP